MASHPPGARDSTPPPLVGLAEDRLRATLEGDVGVCFGLEGAPPQDCATRADRDGLTFTTRVSGRVAGVSTGALELETPARVILRHALPHGLDLRPLTGRQIVVTVRDRLAAGARSTVDAEIRDVAGALLLWGHDGQMPTDREAHGFSVRATLDAQQPRLAIVGSGGVASVGRGAVGSLEHEGRRFAVVVLRVAPDDASFLVLSR